MDMCFFDLETTSQYANTAEVLSLGYITIDSKFVVKDAKLMFFSTDKEVPNSASAVNGLTKGKLSFLSEGKYFEDCAKDIYTQFKRDDLLYCGYNSSTYDLNVLARNLVNVGEAGPSSDVASVFKGMKSLDLLKPVRQAKLGLVNNKLGTVFQHVVDTSGISKASYNALFASICTKFGLDSGCSLHTALYDSFITASILFGLTGRGVDFEQSISTI